MFRIFFFKQKTAYEMRISDWSSDVCSSDLPSLGRLSPISSKASIRIGPIIDRSRLCGCAIHRKKSLFRSHETTPKHIGRNKERVDMTYKPPNTATLIGFGDVMIATYDEALLDPAATVLKAGEFNLGNCE